MKELLELTKALVEIDSTNPGAYEGEIGDFVRKWLEEYTPAEVIVQKVFENRYNIIATLWGTSREEMLIDINHMDVVIAGEGWTRPPFVATCEGDRLYGRGALDMKAGLAIGMLLFRDISSYYKEEKGIPRLTYRLVCTVDEEGDHMEGVETLIRGGYVPKESVVIDHEPTDEKIASGHKGKIFFKIRSQNLHSLLEIIRDLAAYIDSVSAVDRFGKCSICFGMLQKEEEYFTTMDIRLTPALSPDKVIHFVEELTRQKGEYEVLLSRPAIPFATSSHPLIAHLQGQLKRRDKDSDEVLFNGYTDTAVIAQYIKEARIASFGPRGYGLHQSDEWVSISSMMDIYHICKEAYLEYLGMDRVEDRKIRVTLKGKRAHGSTPWQGEDSIRAMSEWILSYMKIDELFLESCLGGDSINVMAESCQAIFRDRTKRKDVLDEIAQSLRPILEKYPKLSYSIEEVNA